MNEASAPLVAWESFWVIVGSSAGALTGLQFVVMTLISEGGAVRGSEETLAAFGSPNVVHFCAALLVSAICSAPWAHTAPVGVTLAIIGLAGVVYSLAVLRRASRQQDYRPVLEDWIWHAVLPTLAYAGMLLAGAALVRAANGALYVVAAAALLLVFVGIHNAWDTVTYVTVERGKRQRREAEAARAAAGPKPPGPNE